MRDDHALEMTVAGHHHTAFDLADPSGVGEVRRFAVQLAEAADFDDVAAGRVAIVATELGNNLVRHAQGGRMLVGRVDTAADDAPVLEILSLDRGPGIRDVGASLADGYSTGGTPGTGLGAVRRLSQRFDLYTAPGAGTVVMARLTASGSIPSHSGAFDVGAIRIPAPGESVCGDNWLLTVDGTSALLQVADGLGHGPQAAEAADAAVAAHQDDPSGPPSQLLERVHQVLRGTRGAAVAAAQADADAGTIAFAGIGNIAGRIISGVGDRTLLSQHGTAGAQVRRVTDIAYDWPAHAVLLLHSDGLTTRWTLDGARDVLQHHPSVVAGWIVRDQVRGRDDATIVVLKRRDH